jgi:hypothetical protein
LVVLRASEGASDWTPGCQGVGDTARPGGRGWAQQAAPLRGSFEGMPVLRCADSRVPQGGESRKVEAAAVGGRSG